MGTPYPKTGMNLDDPHSLSEPKLVFVLPGDLHPTLHGVYVKDS